MDDQCQKADHGDGLAVALGAVLDQHAAQGEQGRGQGSAYDQRQRVVDHTGDRQPAKVYGKAREDAQNQRIVEHRPRHIARKGRTGLAPVAHELHHRDPQPVAKRRVDGDDRKVPDQRLGPIGAFGDRQPQQDRVGKETAEPDGHTVFPVAFEQDARAEQTQREADGRAGVEAEQQSRVERGREIQMRDRLEQQAGDREALREPHDPVDARDRKIPSPDRDIAKADDKEDGQDDFEKRLHERYGLGCGWRCRSGGFTPPRPRGVYRAK